MHPYLEAWHSLYNQKTVEGKQALSIPLLHDQLKKEKDLLLLDAFYGVDESQKLYRPSYELGSMNGLFDAVTTGIARSSRFISGVLQNALQVPSPSLLFMREMRQAFGEGFPIETQERETGQRQETMIREVLRQAAARPGEPDYTAILNRMAALDRQGWELEADHDLSVGYSMADFQSGLDTMRERNIMAGEAVGY